MKDIIKKTIQITAPLDAKRLGKDTPCVAINAWKGAKENE